MNDASTIRLSRIIMHPPEFVFAAFSSANAIARWLSPSDDISMSVLKFNFVVEGAYEYVFGTAKQGELRLSGRFLEIDPPKRLSFSWRWHEPDPHAGIDSHVTIEFSESPEGTHLSLVHAMLNGEGMNNRHGEGWIGSLSRLEKHLS